MNCKISIEINKDSFYISKYKSITGEIYFKVDDRFFPEEGWSDFPVVILTWWIKSLLQIIQGKVGISQEFLFMDGPLLIKGKKVDIDIMELEFIHREVLQFTSYCSISSFKSSVVEASKITLESMIKNGWETSDTKELESLYKNLK
ncbi:MAG TPA: hypothetical protein PLH43_04155 [Acetivibrio sp.]|uniref:hypothetical protein n=1 Tax=Acetivibrio sp. TaxID=1872092 RepID=UPI002C8E85F2|nr:hypothetical protein [Acetivibrio sp.]HOM02003.1 hypothetical protein [Acetivibrio sp.]